MPYYEEQKEFSEQKRKLKAWEKEFLETNQRKPGKCDIRNAPTEIKEAYRNYWKLKGEIKRPKVCEDDAKNSKLNAPDATEVCNENFKTVGSETQKKNSVNQGDVWSTKFNKHQQEKNSGGIIEKFCDKIRQKSQSKIIQNVLIPSEKKPIVQDKPIHKKDVVKQLDSLTNNNICVKRLDIKCERNESSVKIDYSNALHERKSISVLSPLTDFKNVKTKLLFGGNISCDWLERCKKDIFNNLVASTDSEDNIASCYSQESDSFNNANEKHISARKLDLVSDNSSIIFDHNNLKNENSVIDDQTSISNFVNNVDFRNETEIVKDFKNLIANQNADYCPASSSCPKTGPDSEKDNGTNDLRFEKTNSLILENVGQMEVKNSDFLQDCVGDSEIKKEERKNRKRKLSRNCMDKNFGHLRKKMASRTLNDNFVHINIKKKKFSRGHHPVNIKKLKWKKWKQLKENSSNYQKKLPSNSSCFKCGQLGHWAKNCTTAAVAGSNLFPDFEDVGDHPLPTLEEAAQLAKERNTNILESGDVKIYETSHCESQKEREKNCANHLDNHSSSMKPIQVKQIPCFNELALCNTDVKPLYQLKPDGTLIATPNEVFHALNEMGYEEFRKDQEVAVMRVLSGLSTLVVLPTGSGKSLCYQLPAYMYAKHYKCIALVISPLVSLMEDQIRGSPSCVHAVCLHSGMSDADKKASVKDITDGTTQILLVSPEAVIGGFTYNNGFLLSDMPPISFACIDEVHCLSQWSHNFRPSYLQLYKVLTKKLGVKCILGLTATANKSTIKDIISHLALENDDECVVGHTNIPKNLHLSVSRDKDKDQAIIQLLKGDRFSSCSSIIIYCIRRVETERLAAFIRTSMQDEVHSESQTSNRSRIKSKKRHYRWTVEAYHAGLAPPRRRSIQKQFMNGKLRVIIATVAFGMGLDKPDIRAVIHYNMPKSFESYVQEIGRAGRDGLEAHCHLFLDSEGNDLPELQRHIFANSIDRYTIRKLLNKIFVPCKCAALSKDLISKSTDITSELKCRKICPKHEVAFSVNDTVQQLDIKEESISTLLCYLELHSEHWIEVLSPTYETCTIHCYGGAKQMHALALKNPVIATAVALDERNGKKYEKTNHYQFQCVKIAPFMGLNSNILKRELKHLEWNDCKRKTGVLVNFSDLAFHVLAPGDLMDEEQDTILNFLHRKVILTEEQELHNLNSLFSLFYKHSVSHFWECSDQVNTQYSDGIKEAINKYFEENESANEKSQGCEKTNIQNYTEADLLDARAMIQDIICTNYDQSFTGRAIARIFHGIGSPCFPSEVWGTIRKYWRCFLHINFNVILKLANDELKKMKLL